GVRHVRERLADQLFGPVAEDRAELLVEAQETASEVLMGDADGRVLESAAEPLLALAKCLLGPLAVCDVLDDLDAIGRLSRRLDLERAGHVGPDNGAVLADEPFLHCVTGGFTSRQGIKL